MITKRHIYCLARVTLEAKSAHGIHSGMGDHTHDVLLVRDANGLPTLPGTSIAGVLRHRIASQNPDAAERLFGHIQDDGAASMLSVGWGMIHNSQNQPCEGLLTNEQLADSLLQPLLDSKPLVRQRVRLNDRGTAAETGKFDVTLIPAGARYSTLLGYWCDGSEQSRQDWQTVLDLLATSELRLGHGTRNGQGQFKIQSLEQAHWDLKTPEGRTAYQNRSRSRADSTGLEPVALTPQAPLHVSLTLQAEAGWRIGGGEHSLNQHDKEPDLLPQHELRIQWNGNKATLSDQSYLLPGSAIKGAIRHRLAYHYRCLQQDFTTTESGQTTDNCPAVKALFGQSEADTGLAGLLQFSDVPLDASKTDTAVLMHNRIDRFTGGVINGALFSEEVLWKTPLTLRIEIPANPRTDALDADTREALQRTLQDLADGWLPIGANGSRGLGVFSDPSGKGPVWSDQQVFIKGEPVTTAQEAMA
jgi:CRISPR/Cas system CMR subunit Cmr4 (Cas7 group RAMP superfamily)